ncbi:hypothetical protein Pfo_030948 [Paulownia fortunei]|nr:hypothetical protein Pfo_030948 [Paulownia fortunei]
MENFQEQLKNRRTFAIISHPDAGKTTLTEQLLLHGGVIREAGTVKGRGSNKLASSDWMAIEQQRGISVTSSVLQFDYEGKRINILDTPGHEDFSEDTYRTLMAVDSVVMVVDAAKELSRKRKSSLKLCRNVVFLCSLSSTKLIVTHDQRLICDHPEVVSEAMDEIELLRDAGNEFDADKIAHGKLTPVFFGSALVNFGVTEFLREYLTYAPAPGAVTTVDDQVITPDSPQFTGFVFKIQANMDPRHRDRIAFVRIVSGEFDRGMDVTLQRNSKKLKLSNVTQFMAEERENVQTAVPGDIIGVYDTGNFQIGDTIYAGKKSVQFPDLPTFTPELFNRVIAKDVMKQKVLP